MEAVKMITQRGGPKWLRRALESATQVRVSLGEWSVEVAKSKVRRSLKYTKPDVILTWDCHADGTLIIRGAAVDDAIADS